MKDLKIKVDRNNAGEAIDLLVNLGHKLLSTKRGLICEVEQGSTHIVIDGNGIFTTKNYYGVKEITLQELRDMVNPMKEYLEKQADGSYKLVMRGIVGKDDDIEVPEGANFYCDGYFWMQLNGRKFWNGDNWQNDFTTLCGFSKSYNKTILWQRQVQPEELPFMDSLNDQYAEIERVRKQTIEATLAERQAQYGCFEDVARTTGKIMEALSEVRVNGLNDLPYPHRMALYMIASKMARIVNGDFNSIDGWHDIGGYSKLIEDLL